MKGAKSWHTTDTQARRQGMHAGREYVMGDIGPNPKRIEVIPITKPVREAPTEPLVAPAPDREPVHTR